MARDASCNAPQAKPLSSLSVNQYRWINIWTSILGQGLARLPVIFALSLFCANGLAPFSSLETVFGEFSFCFSPAYRYKLRARFICCTVRRSGVVEGAINFRFAFAGVALLSVAGVRRKRRRFIERSRSYTILEAGSFTPNGARGGGWINDPLSTGCWFSTAVPFWRTFFCYFPSCLSVTYQVR